MTKRQLVAVCVVLAVGLAVPATALGQTTSPSASPSDEKVTFTIGVNGDLNSNNIFRQIDTTESFVSTLMYDSLLRRAQSDYATEPELATDWEVSEDGLTWTFHLREDATWSDGKPITAHDFVATGNFIVENDISSWSDGYTYTKSIEAADDYTVVWKTTKPTVVPGLPGYNLILPEHVWGDLSAQEIKSFKNFPDPVVSGPFILTEWKQGEYWKMEANPDYWGEAPNIDELVFRVYNSNEAVVQALLKGAIDYTTVATAALYEAVEGSAGIETTVDSAEAFHQMSFNLADDPKSTANPAVLDPEFRRAMSYAIDRETLIDRVMRGFATPGTTPVVPLYDFWHWEPPAEEIITFDPARARELLDQAGYLDTDSDGIRELPGGGEPISLQLFTASTDADGIKAAPFIQGWFRDVGIDVSLKSMTDAKLYDVWLESLDWDLIIYSWGVGPEPDFIMSSFTSRQCGVWSDTCYSNPEYDDLYKKQQVQLDEVDRQAVIREMQQILYADTPEVVLWYPNSFEAWRSDRWTGFVRWPEPDGVAFWGNPYSVLSVRPVTGASLASTVESGPTGWMWLLAVGAVGGGVMAAFARRRRLDGYYA